MITGPVLILLTRSGRGSYGIQGFKPQEYPGYNANPDETKYYGGVTAGGDGGLKNDGTTEWATGETGKTITESFMNKPKDILHGCTVYPDRQGMW